jgi:hypothetical protein
MTGPRVETMARRQILGDDARMAADAGAKKFARLLTGDSTYGMDALADELGARCKESPELVAVVCDAIRPVVTKVKQVHAFARFAALTRAPAAYALAAELPRIPDWLYVNALAPELDERLRADLKSPHTFAGHAAVLRGMDVRKILRGCRYSGVREALALLGHPDDAELFKRGLTNVEKALYAATSPGKTAKRVAALGRTREYGIIGYAHLMCDPDPEVAAAALAKLKQYGDGDGFLWHGAFLVRAAERIVRGVTPGELKTLRALHARIPMAPPLPSGKTKAEPKLSGDAAKLQKLMHEVARIRVDEESAAELPAPAVPERVDAKLIAKLQAELDAYAALVKKAQVAADVMTAIKKKQGAESGEFGEAQVYRLKGWLEIFVLGDRGYKVKIATGEVFEWRGRQPRPGPKLAEGLDDAIADLKAELKNV